jgi:type II secretory pathway component GspD/PulD (secretin)
MHGNGEITLALEATSSGLGAQNSGGNPTINNTELTTQMRLVDGQTVMLAGMLNKTITNSASGLPGFSSIPGLGLLTSQSIRENDTSDLLIFVTPHLVRAGANQSGLSRAIASPEHMVPVVR